MMNKILIEFYCKMSFYFNYCFIVKQNFILIENEIYKNAGKFKIEFKTRQVWK